MFDGDGEVEFTDVVDPGKADDAAALDHGETKPTARGQGERRGGSLQGELFEKGFNIAIERRVIGSHDLDGGRLHATIMTIRSDAEANSR